MRNLFTALALSIGALALVSGCSSKPVAKRVTQKEALTDYNREKAELAKSELVRPGQTVQIKHGADEQVSGEYKVTVKGQLKLPYKVTVDAAGLTTDELANRIEDAYASFFKSRNNVSVKILSREVEVEVSGLVAKPGIYKVKNDTSLEELIADAGGLPGWTKEGGGQNGKSTRPEFVRIHRPNFKNPDAQGEVLWVSLSSYFLKYDIRNQVLWHGGEKLFFQVAGDASAARRGANSKIQIIGEVKNPGEYPLQDNTDLHSYITQAGGTTSVADLSEVTVIMKSRDDSKTYDLSDSAETPELQDGDAIIVNAVKTKPSFFEKLGPFLISAGGLAVSTVILILTL